MLLQIIHFPISKAPVELQSERRVKRKQIEVESDDDETERMDDKEKQDLRVKKPRLEKTFERTTNDEADDNVLEEDMKTFVGDDNVEKRPAKTNNDNNIGEDVNSDDGLGGASKKEEATEENNVMPGGPDKAGEGDQVVGEIEQPGNLEQLDSNKDEDDEEEDNGEVSNDDVLNQRMETKDGAALNKEGVEDEADEDLVDVEVGNDQPDMEQPGRDQPDVLEQPQPDSDKGEVEEKEEFEGENKEAVLDQPGSLDVHLDVNKLFEPVVSILTEQLEAEDDGVVNDDDVLDQPGMKQPDIEQPDMNKPDTNEEETEHDSAATEHVGKPVEGDRDVQALPSSSAAAEEKTFECIEVSDDDDDEEEREDDHIEDTSSKLSPSRDIKVEAGAVKAEPAEAEPENQPPKETKEQRAMRHKANSLRFIKINQFKTKKQEPEVEVEELEVLGGKIQNEEVTVELIQEHYARVILVKTKDNIFVVAKPEPEEE